MISTILVPTDGSSTANKAAAYAVDLAKQVHASIIVISVMDRRLLATRTVSVGRSLAGVAESIDDFLREAAERYAGEVAKLCQEQGIQSRAVITPGHPVEEIVKEAENSKVPYCHGFPWTKRFGGGDPWQRDLWCDPQRRDNPNSGGKKVT
jgi:nucleotide-binding universal stress UspA family protein